MERPSRRKKLKVATLPAVRCRPGERLAAERAAEKRGQSLAEFGRDAVAALTVATLGQAEVDRIEAEARAAEMAGRGP